MIRLRVRIVGNGQQFRRIATSTAPAARQETSDRLLEAALTEIARLTPAETGRLRRAWQSALEQSGGEGFRADVEETGRSRRRATNTVPYVAYLEYGTRHMAPREIVRRALRRIRSLGAAFFSLRTSDRTG